jgi:hypothetical protein
VNQALRRLEVDDGILGRFRFDANGNITPARFTALRIISGNERPAGTPEDYEGSVVDRVVQVESSLPQP